jgi:hypothetical protein
MREELLRQLVPGITPCARCGQPMWPETERLDLDHADHDRALYIGLSHAACNRSAGGARAHLTPEELAQAELLARARQMLTDPNAPVCPECGRKPACGTPGLGVPSRCW